MTLTERELEDLTRTLLVQLELKWGGAYRQALDEQRKLTEQYRHDVEELKTIIIKAYCTPNVRVEGRP